MEYLLVAIGFGLFGFAGGFYYGWISAKAIKEYEDDI